MFVCLLHVSLLCFSLLNGSIHSEYNAGYFYCQSYPIITYQHDSQHANPYYKFHSVTVLACRLLWSSPTVATWAKFRTSYHKFMMIRSPGRDEARFQLQGVGLPLPLSCSTWKSLSRGFHGDHVVHIPFTFCTFFTCPAEGPPPLPTPSAPQLPNSLVSSRFGDGFPLSVV